MIRFEASTEHVFEARRWRSFSREQAPVAVLLVASSRDRDLLRPTLNLLANQRCVIYIDFREEGFSDPPSAEAEAWTTECMSLDGRFVLVATPSGLRSDWALRQLECAERTLGLRNAAILPVDDFGFMRPHPLLRRYPTIRRLGSEWRVVGPGGKVGPSLRSWLAP